MIAEFPCHLGVKLSPVHREALSALAHREQTTASAVIRKLIEREAQRDVQPTTAE